MPKVMPGQILSIKAEQNSSLKQEKMRTALIFVYCKHRTLQSSPKALCDITTLSSGFGSKWSQVKSLKSLICLSLTPQIFGGAQIHGGLYFRSSREDLAFQKISMLVCD